MGMMGGQRRRKKTKKAWKREKRREGGGSKGKGRWLKKEVQCREAKGEQEKRREEGVDAKEKPGDFAKRLPKESWM